MNHINVMLFLAVLELAVVFMVMWVWWFLKSRKQAQQIAALQSVAKPADTPDATPAAPTTERDDYILQELAATHTQLGVQSEAAPELSTIPLTLRAAYLDLEREFAQSQERDPDFWENARERLAALIEEFAPATAPAVPEDEMLVAPETDASGAAVDVVDAQHVKKLVDKQASTITELKDALTLMVGDQENGPEIIERVDKLGRATRELSMCVAILEDDNNLLRERLLSAGIIAD